MKALISQHLRSGTDNWDVETKRPLIPAVTHGQQLHTSCHSVLAAVKRDFVRWVESAVGLSAWNTVRNAIQSIQKKCLVFVKIF